jgi:hypothetical protein
MAGAVIGAIVGGRTGNVISQTTQFGLGTAFLRFGREYERQADILGSQIMARAGYDPRDMANMFKTIEKQGGSGGPQWLSDHPNPGDRYAYITKEAQSLRVENPVRDTERFQQVKARLSGMPPAPTTEEATKNGRNRTPSGSTGSTPTGSVQPPSSSFTTWREANLFRIAAPSNWREIPEGSSVTFAPDGAVGAVKGQSVFTHGVQVGLARNETHDLQTATDELIQSLGQSNPRLSRPSGYEPATVGGQSALRTTLSNVSDATGRDERIEIFSSLMRDGTLFYLIGVAPSAEFNRYEPVFRRVAESVQFVATDR